jgi:hypothetical protein
LAGNLLPGVTAIDASRQQLIIRGVSMTDRGIHRGRERALIEIPSRGCSSHAPAVPRGGVRGDRRRLTGRTAGKELSNFHGHPSDQFTILFLPPGGAGSPRFRAFPGVRHTLLFRLF